MSRISHEMRSDMRKSPEQLEHEIDVTRSDLEATLEALERRLSPNELFNQALTQVRRHGGEFAQNLGDSVKQNPLPTLLTSIGIAWLMAANGKPAASSGYEKGELRRRMNDTRDTMRRGRQTVSHAAQRAKDALHRGQEAAEEGIASSRAALSHSADRLRSTARGTSSALDSARSEARDAASRARRRARSLRYDAQHLIADQPLLLGAIGLAAGAIAGAALPPSEQEDETLGPMRDRALDRAKAAGTRGLKQAREKAEQAVESIESQSRSDGIDAGPASRSSGWPRPDSPGNSDLRTGK
ncbi:MAG TPA: DUF3618 domain-containing protein [Gammaproteobacteria bacterium]|nr:DUF3618 domain-containing protein [Gammaproteobacteria bacterium]